MKARWEEDREGMIEVALSLAPVVEKLARDIAEEIRTSPQTPREDGDYAESWRSGRAKLDPTKTSISAIAFSRYRPPGAEAPLGVILEYGAVLDNGAVLVPQPHIRAAANRVQARSRNLRAE